MTHNKQTVISVLIRHVCQQEAVIVFVCVTLPQVAAIVDAYLACSFIILLFLESISLPGTLVTV